MGDRVEGSALVVGQGDEVHRRLQRCVAALQRMVDGGWFVGHEDTVGMEVEFDLVDPLGRPRLVNDAVLARLGREDMQHELGQFNWPHGLACPSENEVYVADMNNWRVQKLILHPDRQRGTAAAGR